MLAQLKECWDLLQNPPSSTQTHMVSHDRIAYPAVTFCFKNDLNQGYDLRILGVSNSLFHARLRVLLMRMTHRRSTSTSPTTG